MAVSPQQSWKTIVYGLRSKSLGRQSPFSILSSAADGCTILDRIRRRLRRTAFESRIAARVQYMIATRPTLEEALPPFSCHYQPLHREGRSIRLLQILPGSRGSPIICQLTYAYLNSGAHYEALSYTWASSEPARRIQLDGRLFPVSGNLWLALERFRRPDHPRSIWVDQICINQSDEMEKSYQVRQMGAVYGQAQEVLIWLGPASNDASLAVQAFQAYAAGDPKVTDALRTRHSKPWRAVMKLMGKPYWNRVWIIQEIAHARKKTIYYGDHELSWEDFCFLVRDQGAGIVRRSQAVPASHRHHLVVVRPTPAVALAQFSRDRALLTQLTQFRYALQTDPRDKIYAFSTLTNDLGIFPDYTKSVREVYTHAPIVHIRRYRSLNIICQSYFEEARLDLASWVPDWSLKSGPRPLLYDTCGQAPGLTDLKCEAADIQVDEKRQILFVHGVHVDTVQALRDTIHEVRDISLCLGDWALAVQSQIPEADPRRRVAELYSAAMEQMSLASAARPQRGSEGRSTSYSLPKEWLTGPNLNAINHLSKIVFRRRLFLTAERWWGIGPKNAQDGDEVCFLQGCDIPVLLRRQDDHHVFVGEVDIHPAVAYGAAVQAFVSSNPACKPFAVY